MFDENIKKIREDKKLGVNELSRISGVNASYISALERGEKKNPTVTTLKKIAKALDVTVDELLQSEPVTYEKLKEWDEKYADLKEEIIVPLEDKFKTVEDALQFLLSQNVIMSDLNLEDLSNERKIEFANEIYTMMKMLAPKYKK